MESHSVNTMRFFPDREEAARYATAIILNLPETSQSTTTIIPEKSVGYYVTIVITDSLDVTEMLRYFDV
jgi:hypothetical protein